MTDWKDVYVVDTKIPARAKNAMVAEFGDAVTLGDVADMPLGELRRLKGVGAAAVQRVVDVVADVIRGNKPRSGMSIFDAAMEKVEADE